MYDLEESYIATIRDDIPSLNDPEQIRELCVDDDASEEDSEAEFKLAQRTNNRIVLRWFEGPENNEQYTAQLEPENPNDDSDTDFWQWQGKVTAKYICYDAGLQADTPEPVTELGKIEGLLFEQSGGVTFVGEITWNNSGERERVVIELFDGSE